MHVNRTGSGFHAHNSRAREGRLTRSAADTLAIAESIAGADDPCSAVSPESKSPCVLPDSRAAHLAGHESARVQGVRVCWSTTDEERARWASQEPPAPVGD